MKDTEAIALHTARISLYKNLNDNTNIIINIDKIINTKRFRNLIHHSHDI